MLKILTNNRLFFIFFLVWVLFGAILQLISSPTDLMFLINQHHSLELDAFFRFVTTLGEDTIWLILLLALLYRHFVKKVKQTAIVKFLLDGKSTTEIAELLNVKSNTISTYKRRIFDKTEASSVIELSKIFR